MELPNGWHSFKTTYEQMQLKAGPRMAIFTRTTDKQQVTVSGGLLKEFMAAGRGTATEYRITMLGAEHTYIYTDKTTSERLTIAAGEGIRIETRMAGLKGSAVFKQMAGLDWAKRADWYMSKIAHVTVGDDGSQAVTFAPAHEPVKPAAPVTAVRAKRAPKAVKAAKPVNVPVAAPEPVQPVIMASSIKFSLSLDCYIRRPAVGNAGLDRLPAGWAVLPTNKDTAVHGGKKYSPITISSPTMAGEDGLSDAVYVLDELNRLKAAGDHHGGLLISIDTSKMSRDQAGAIITSFTTYARAFYGLNGISGQPIRKLKVTDKAITFGLNSTLEAETVVTALYLVTALVSRAASEDTMAMATIADARLATRYFIQAHFMHSDYQIMTGEDIGEVTDFMHQRAKLAAAA